MHRPERRRGRPFAAIRLRFWERVFGNRMLRGPAVGAFGRRAPRRPHPEIEWAKLHSNGAGKVHFCPLTRVWAAVGPTRPIA